MNILGRGRHLSPLLAGVMAGTLIALVVGVMAAINFDYGAPWATTHTLHVQVTGADAMSGGSDVRIAGRTVGQVVSTQAKGTYSDIVVKIDQDNWPLPADTKASVRLATLLGAKYVQLQPGTAHSALRDDGIIRVTSTQAVVDFDQVLNTFDTPTRASLTALIRTLGTPKAGALAGQEGVLQQLIPNLAQLSNTSVPDTAELANRDPQLNTILSNLATTSTALAQSASDLTGTIDNLNSISGALAAHTSALEGFISKTDSVNQTANAILGNGGAQQLNSGLQQVGPVVQNLNTLLATMAPETRSYRDTAMQASVNLIYEIGDATSQSNQSGYFLRQNPAGVDLSGLVPIQAAVPLSGPPGSTPPQPPALPAVPTLPLPKLPIPTLPPLPSLGIPTCVPVPPLSVPGVLTAPTPTPVCIPQPGTAAPAPTPSSGQSCVFPLCGLPLDYSGSTAQAWLTAYTASNWWENR